MAKKARYLTNYDTPKQQKQSSNQLPTDKRIAVYYRQSTMAQVGNVSTTMQQVNLPAYIQIIGWSEDKITLIDEDAGIDGTTAIDEREGMRRMYDMILNCEIGAVAVQDEDRLFRDDTQIQPNIFIDACKSAKVLVITPMMIYSFHDPKLGYWHIKMFRQKAEYAADYITSYIIGRLNAAKRLKALSGVWTGGNMPLGFIVNPEDKFEPFPLCVETVNEYFKLVVRYEGN